MARPFKICPDCGAHLDASEPCDCKDAIEREPPKPWERLKLLAVCREVDKESGRVSVYPLDLEITSEILASLKMRAQFNPELRYFTTTTARWDRYGEVMAGTGGAFHHAAGSLKTDHVLNMARFLRTSAATCRTKNEKQTKGGAADAWQESETRNVTKPGGYGLIPAER